MSNLSVDNIKGSDGLSGSSIEGNVVFSGTSHIVLPKGTTAQRPTGVPAGSLRFNTDTKLVEQYNGIEWVTLYSESVITYSPTERQAIIDVGSTDLTPSISISDGSKEYTEYRVFVDDVQQNSVYSPSLGNSAYDNNTTINASIATGANRILKLEVWRSNTLIYSIIKNVRIFSYTGASQSWTVPSGVTSVLVDISGAQGGNFGATLGGFGGRLNGNISVTPGESLNIYIGGKGQDGSALFSCTTSAPSVLTGGFNGGGSGGRLEDSYNCPSGSTYRLGSSGGGASDIRRGGTALTDRIIIAGGGGGAWREGGAGNGAGNGEDGLSSGLPYWPDTSKGGGGTTTAGGAAGLGVVNGTAGSLGQGGNGAVIAVYGNNPGAAGGGGGGYYGGGGGGSNSNYGSGGSGGGGSGFITGGIFQISTLGYRQGDGGCLFVW